MTAFLADHATSIIALSMIATGAILLWPRKTYADVIDLPRERARRALTSAPTGGNYGNSSRYSVPTFSAARGSAAARSGAPSSPRTKDERTPPGWGSTATAPLLDPSSSRRGGSARPYTLGLVKK